MHLRLTYDCEANAAFIHLKDRIEPGEAERTDFLDAEYAGGPILLEIDKNDKLLGIEILAAREALPAETLEALTGPTKPRVHFRFRPWVVAWTGTNALATLKLRTTTDRAANSVFIHVKDPTGCGEEMAATRCEGEYSGGPIILRTDKSGRLLGFEILSAAEALPAETMEARNEADSD